MVQIFGNKSFEEINFQDIQGLINRNEEESIILEFKEKLSSNSKEIAKDLSCMSNSEGGIQIYGLGEDSGGKASVINWINSSEKFEEKLENIITTTINPPIPFKIFPIKKEESENEFVYVVVIPKSDNLHMVIKGGDNRYYKRVGKTVQKMEDSEIKEKIILINLQETSLGDCVNLLRSNFQEYTGTNLISTKRINYFVIPNSLGDKVRTISELKSVLNEIRNPFSDGLNLESYKSTISNHFFTDDRKHRKCTITHKNGVFEFRRSHEYAECFALVREVQHLLGILNFVNQFYKKINYFGGYKIYIEIGNLGEYYFGKTMGNSQGSYPFSLGELIDSIELDPLLVQDQKKNNLAILELMKMVGGVVGARGEAAYECIKVPLGLSEANITSMDNAF